MIYTSFIIISIDITFIFGQENKEIFRTKSPSEKKILSITLIYKTKP